MADSKSLFQSWQRQTYFLKCSSNSVYCWHLSYRSPVGLTLGVASLGGSQSLPSVPARRVPGGIQDHGQHPFLQGSGRLPYLRSQRPWGSHPPEPVQMETCLLVAGLSNFFYFQQVERLQMSKNMSGYFPTHGKEMYFLYL